jgi:hypothetical protein
MTLLEFYENHPERWTQGAFARDSLGVSVPVGDDLAVCFCLVGAIGKLGLYDASAITRVLVRGGYGYEHGIVDFNDSHTFNEVLAVVREAGI